MIDAKRGEVWLVNFGVPVGCEGGYARSAVVVSSDMLNAGPGGVIVVVPTTTSRRGLPAHVEIEPGESGLEETRYAKCEGVKSVTVERLVHRFGAASPAAVHRIARTLRYVLEL